MNDKEEAHDVIHEYQPDDIEDDLYNPKKSTPTTADDNVHPEGTNIINKEVVVLALIKLYVFIWSILLLRLGFLTTMK